MKIFFEEYLYPIEELKKYFSPHFYTVDKNRKNGSINYVGYFFCCNEEDPSQSDSVFILPKVFLNEAKEPFELEGVKPEDIVSLDIDKNEKLKQLGVADMVFELSVWLYRAILFYEERNQDTKILENANIQNVVSNKGEESSTFLDIVLQLRAFHKEHRNLITYITIINSSGNNKIHWGKTIAHEQPVIKNNVPAYVNFRNKQKAVNLDEDLIVLFYSVLDYLRHKFHFKVNLDIKYTLLKNIQIQSMIDSCKGTRYLKTIRKKYFTDEFVSLWKLLYVFFDKAERIANKRYHEEVLLAKDFDRVFEDMVDYLISSEDYPNELKNQNGGEKMVDHIYDDESLVYNEKIYYVGDSKYYKPGRDVEGNDISKQYMYAKNIIQRNVDVICQFHEKDRFLPKEKRKKYFKYRDDVTEGYNVTPNFFISGIVRRKDGKYLFNEHQLENMTKDILYNRHFENRLFDRDTLILQRYNINFLYVLTSYAVQQQYARDQFRETARHMFKADLTRTLNKNYRFFQICLPKDMDMKEFVDENFRQLVGKVFSYDDILIYAVQRKSEEEAMIPKVGEMYLELKGKEYELQEYTIGESIEKKYEKPWRIYAFVDEKLKYDMYLPLYSIKGACGRFLYNEEPHILGWIDVSSLGKRWNENYYIVQAKGRSMEPTIMDGDYCIMQYNWGGTRNGYNVLAEAPGYDEYDGGSYTIKSYSSEQRNMFEKTITLRSLNPEFKDVKFQYDSEFLEDVKIAGVAVEVLRNS